MTNMLHMNTCRAYIIFLLQRFTCNKENVYQEKEEFSVKRKVLPCFMALSMTLTAVPNVAMAEEKQLQETEKTSIVENEALETESLRSLSW